MNENFMNDIKKEIEDNSPFISDLLPLEILKSEYAENKFEACFDEVYKRYT